MTYEIPIQGPHKIPGFNGVGEINLEDYLSSNVQPPDIKSGTFSHVGVLDLDTIDENDDKWLNIGIREEGNTEERNESFMNSYEIRGWRTTYVPPILSIDGQPRDGRGRIISAKRRGERYIPVYYYVIEDDSEKSRVTDGLTENLRHDPAFRATRESVIVGCLYLIRKGEMRLTKTEILDYLHRELHIEKIFSNDNVTKILNAVLSRGEGGGDPLVLVKTRRQWEAFCEKVGKKIDNKKVFLFSADNLTYVQRAWCQHILPAIVKNDAPIEIILFTGNHIPKDARENIKSFQTSMEYFLDSSYLMVEKDYAPGWTMGELKLPVKSVPYKILGCVPQVIGKHDSYYKGNRFVKIEDY